jgi:RimJ/RimL family protein N-acetyltransferase
MVDISPFMPADIAELNVQSEQIAELTGLVHWQAMARAAAEAGPAWTGRHHGRVIGVAGLAIAWRGRATTWCILGHDIPKPAWIGIHRAVRARLAQLPAIGVRRVEAETAIGFHQAEHWVRLLGFEPEGIARRYGPDGRDFTRWGLLL